jgi:hypothetical protein
MWYSLDMNHHDNNLMKQIAAGRVRDGSPVRGYFYEVI